MKKNIMIGMFVLTVMSLFVPGIPATLPCGAAEMPEVVKSNQYSTRPVLENFAGDQANPLAVSPDIEIEPLTINLSKSLSESNILVENKSIKTLVDRSIHMKRGIVNPDEIEGGTSYLKSLSVDEKRHVLVQFGHFPSTGERKALAFSGIRILRYIPNNTFWVAASETAVKSESSIQTAGGIQWSWRPTPEYKMSAAIENDQFPPNARYSDGSVRINVLKFEDISKTEFISLIHSTDSEVEALTWISDNIITVKSPLYAVEAIASLDGVEWVEPADPPDISNNETAAERISVDSVRDPPLSLSGSGVKVGVWDQGAVFNHNDFGDRLTVVDSSTVSYHSTHVAGTIAGNGAGNSNATGMAPEARIESYNWINDEAEMRLATEDDIVISNHSYSSITGWYLCSGCTEWADFGDTRFGRYSTATQEWDDIVFDTGLTIFKSAGNDRNDGPDRCPGGSRCDGPYDSIPAKGIAKNIITVGATTDTDAMTTFSSWGPADDGRVKPDLCANGVGLLSTMPNNNYGWISGTSMASPSAAGAAALLFEHFENISGRAPAAATLKALMIHGAEDLGNEGPDYEFGWGLVNTETSADLISRRNWQTGSITQTGMSQTCHLAVPDNQGELKITLVWTDPAGSPAASIALVNDLDLTLIDPNGVEHQAWVLDLENPELATVKGENHIDNVEQVVVSNPASGNWTVQVSGFSIPFGPQEFSLVGCGIESSFTIFNHGTDNLQVTAINKEQESSWLSFTPLAPYNIEPGSQQIVTVSADTTGLPSGLHTDRLIVSSNDPDENPYPNAVYVNLTIGCDPPVITQEPADATVLEGQDATFTITATGTAPLHYQWKIGTMDVGQDSPILTLPGVQLSDDGSEITCVVDNDCGTITAASETVVLTVTPLTCMGDLDIDFDVDGSDLAAIAAGGSAMNLSDFAPNFGKTGCP